MKDLQLPYHQARETSFEPASCFLHATCIRKFTPNKSSHCISRNPRGSTHCLHLTAHRKKACCGIPLPKDLGSGWTVSSCVSSLPPVLQSPAPFQTCVSDNRFPHLLPSSSYKQQSSLNHRTVHNGFNQVLPASGNHQWGNLRSRAR